ncbi:glycosyltransferase family protein [Aneurinibacillus sp. Ricciae_BoGa-3]|uniref:glycosyltransferase family protein n=1 Tax=Aneurinibacillus sp. Ricciae_BoGa-3 TaxID=3022697 RepID=UPI002341A0AD|nr:glycosyltransferase family protein [Aneurinibacillus sp. Ricciae_BoGa-3]WCK54189.1 glycosyltransferase family protein [Aneurinibacillus sp. Ricciae_BoGa-3]
MANNKRIVAIVQARMTSTRLPGKALKTVLEKSLLEYQLERLTQTTMLDNIVVATTINTTDQPIVDLCKKLKVNYYRGSENHVLSRYYEAAHMFQAQIVVRLTSDCPLIDPQVVDDVINAYLHGTEHYDYVSNTLTRTYPRGLDVEVFSIAALSEAYKRASSPAEIEHVTPYIYHPHNNFRLGNLGYKEDKSFYRWTVDTPEDFELIKNIIESLYPINCDFKMLDVFELLTHHPEWPLINQHIEQKSLENK